MRRSVWTADGLDLEDVEPGPLEPGWVRLRVEACGICGSDLHFWHGHLRRPLGTSPGHELAGTVIGTGMGGAFAFEAGVRAVDAGGPRRVPVLTIPRTMPNAGSAAVSMTCARARGCRIACTTRACTVSRSRSMAGGRRIPISRGRLSAWKDWPTA